jgi:hypothetical protein
MIGLFIVLFAIKDENVTPVFVFNNNKVISSISNTLFTTQVLVKYQEDSTLYN